MLLQQPTYLNIHFKNRFDRHWFHKNERNDLQKEQTASIMLTRHKVQKSVKNVAGQPPSLEIFSHACSRNKMGATVVREARKNRRIVSAICRNAILATTYFFCWIFGESGQWHIDKFVQEICFLGSMQDAIHYPEQNWGARYIASRAKHHLQYPNNQQKGLAADNWWHTLADQANTCAATFVVNEEMKRTQTNAPDSWCWCGY